MGRPRRTVVTAPSPATVPRSDYTGRVFQRALVTYELGLDPGPAIALARSLASRAARIDALARLPVSSHLWLAADQRWRSVEERIEADRAAIERIARTLAHDGIALHADLAPDLDRAAIERAAQSADAELVVFGPFAQVSPAEIAAAAEELRAAAGVTVALPGLGAPTGRPVRHLLCPFDGDLRTLAGVGAVLRGRSGPQHRVTLLSLRRGALPAPTERDLPDIAELVGVRAEVELRWLDAGWLDLGRALADLAMEIGADAFLLPDAAFGGVVERIAALAARRLAGQTSLPALLVPPLPAALADRTGRLDAADVVLLGGPVLLDLDAVGALGQVTPVDAPVVVVAGGEVLARARPRAGRLALDPAALDRDPRPAALGLGRLEAPLAPPEAAPGAPSPVAAVEAHVALLRPGAERVALADARLGIEELGRLRAELTDEGRALWAVRVAPEESFAAVRSRLAAAGVERPRVLDVRSILDEGDAHDVPPDVDDVRLCRVAARLRAAGVNVDAVACLPPGRAMPLGFALLPPAALPEARARIERAFIPSDEPLSPRAARLVATAGAVLIPGNDVRVHLDNAAARRALLELIEGAQQRVHLQSYMVEEDEISAAVEAALRAAAARGVEVRVLADSLYSFHGSFGTENSVIARLADIPGVDVRVARPIEGLPSIEDLKQRDHRKLLIADGRVAIVGGRNLGRTYYTAFDEVALTPRARWADVPWLDASARVEGPAAAALDAAFLAAWADAGGAPFPRRSCPERGGVAAWLVVHRGLRDANTLEAYLALIDHARTELHVVNGFPLQLEVQHALLRAIARGVRVQVLIGRVRPVYGDREAFAGGAIRELADELVRARVDPLVAAGAEVYELGLRPRPGWDPALRLVRPSVHAKILIADREVCTLGSANLDITAGYWESEVLLVIEDVATSAALAAEIEVLLATSLLIHEDAPSFRDGASWRALLGRYWPSLVG